MESIIRRFVVFEGKLRSFPVLVLLLIGALYPAAVAAQPVLNVIGWVPDTLTVTNQPTATIQYDVTNTPANPVDVTFFRDDGASVSIAGVTPGTGPFTIQVPLYTGVDRRSAVFSAVVRDTVTNVIVPGNRQLTVLCDDTGPDGPNITSPTFPATVYTDILDIRGNVNNNPPPGGNTDLAEDGGSIFVSIASSNLIIGGGAIQSTADFLASVDLLPVTTGLPTNLNVWAVDSAGNVGTTITVQVTKLLPPPPALTDLQITPPDGTITRNPGVLVSGRVVGDVPPLTVNFFVDGLLESQIYGLNSGDRFNHTLNLPSEGAHVISVQAVNGNTPPSFGQSVTVGTITLDRTDPAAPTIVTPNPASSPFVTRETSFAIRGFSAERDTVTTDSYKPLVLLEGPVGMSFNPGPPLDLAANGEFNATADITALPDGTHTVVVRVVDEAGNTGPTSVAQIDFIKDTTAPSLEEIRVNGVIAPQSNPEIYVGQESVALRLRVSEAMLVAPELLLTQTGASERPAGLTSSTTQVFNFAYGVTPFSDGPVDIRVAGGEDRAGNPIAATRTRMFIVDTTAPRVLAVDPSEGTSTPGNKLTRVRVRFEDPASTAGTFSGIDLMASQVTVSGPIGSTTTMPGTVTVFDPYTIDFVPTGPVIADGTYRVSVVAIDKVGNKANTYTTTFIVDNTPITLNDRVVTTLPANGAYVNAQTMPGTAATPFVAAWVDDPQFDPENSTIISRDYCRIPTAIAGTQESTSPTNLTYNFDKPLATNGNQDGVYTIELEVKDFAGNGSPTYITTFTYDTQLPSVTYTFPSTDAKVRGPLRIVDASFVDRRVDYCRQNSGIDRANSTLELWLVQGNPSTNANEPGQIPGLLRFVSVGEVDKALLEVVDQNQYVTGLATDGSQDGLYELRVVAVDRAGNASEPEIRRFTYDTQAPIFSVTELDDRVVNTISGTSFTLSGKTRDNVNGTGINRVVASLRSVSADGGQTTNVPIFENIEAKIDPIGLGPFDPDPPERSWTFTGDLAHLEADTLAVLKLRSYDEAGNFTELAFDVQLRRNPLVPPQLSSPADDATTSNAFQTFRWNPVGGADGYRLRIVTPNQNQYLFEAPTNELKVNVAAFGDGDGAYAWTVATKDASGNVGPYARNRLFRLDVAPPRIITLDVTDPSPEAVGSVNEGEVRISMRFSEVMDVSRPLTVTVAPADLSAPPLTVEKISWIQDTWTGRLVIPEATANTPDYNGLARVSVQGGYDLGGHLMLQPQEGFTLFEIDTGPYFQIAFFQNPVNTRDLILVIKGFTRKTGLPEHIIDPPSLTAERQGLPKQTPICRRIDESSFHCTLAFDELVVDPIRLTITGRDAEGNTATRELFIQVERINSNAGGVILTQSETLALTAAPGALTGRSSLLVVPAKQSLSNLPPAQEGAELRPLVALDGIGPFGTTFRSDAELLVNLTKALPEGDASLRSRTGLYRQDEGGWKALPSQVDGELLRARLDKLGPLALMADVKGPSFGAVSGSLGARGGSLQLAVTDGGSGVRAESLEARIDGKAARMTWNAASGQAVIEALEPLAAGAHSLELRACDQVGNEALATASVVATGPLRFGEVSAYPNPARSATTLRYRLDTGVDELAVAVYDGAGRLVIRLDPPSRSAGTWPLAWDLRNRRGRSVANGIYFVRFAARLGGEKCHEFLKVAVRR